MRPSPWIRGWRARMPALLDLLCFPEAGAGPDLCKPWTRSLPGFAEINVVCLPGRGGRAPEETTLHDAAVAIARGWIAEDAQRPVAFLAQGFGGILAYETACRLHTMGAEPPAALIFAGTPPLGPSPKRLEELARLLRQSFDRHEAPETAPRETLAGDLAMLAGHDAPDGRARVKAPLHLLIGQDDPLAVPGAGRAWRARFQGHVEEYAVPGGHFTIFGEGKPTFERLMTRILQKTARGGV